MNEKCSQLRARSAMEGGTAEAISWRIGVGWRLGRPEVSLEGCVCRERRQVEVPIEDRTCREGGQASWRIADRGCLGIEETRELIQGLGLREERMLKARTHGLDEWE